MIITKTISEPQEFIIGYRCDKCKKVFDDKTDPDGMEIQEFHHIRFSGGYCSVFGDMNEISLDICQHCLYDMIGDLI